MRKLVFIGVFLSSIVPAMAHGDFHDGVGIRNFTSDYCSSLERGNIGDRFVSRRLCSLAMFEGAAEVSEFTPQAPIPYLVDVSEWLSHTTWTYRSRPLPAYPEIKKSASSDWIVAILIGYLALLLIFFGLSSEPMTNFEDNDIAV